MAYAVARRTRELAIRETLGADQADVIRQVVLRGLRLAGIGLTLGLVAAYLAASGLQRYLYGLAPWDPLTFTLASTVIVGAAILACWIPARRASSIDPTAALRLE